MLYREIIRRVFLRYVRNIQITTLYRQRMWKILVAFAKFCNKKKCVVMAGLSFRPNGTTRLPLEGSSWNLMFWIFFRKSVEKKYFLHEDVCTLWQYISKFFLEWEISRQNTFYVVLCPQDAATERTASGNTCHVIIILLCERLGGCLSEWVSHPDRHA